MPYYNNPYQQNQYMYQQPQYQQSPIIWVQGLESAKAYPVQPGASVLLMDSDANVFYIKSADNSGMPNLRIFDYAERIAQPQQPKEEQSQYITREEFEERIAQLTVPKTTSARKEKVTANA